MLPSDKEAKRWTLVIDLSNGPQQTHVVNGDRREDVDAVMVAIRAELRNMAARGGCRTMVIGVHVAGAECDHLTVLG